MRSLPIRTFFFFSCGPDGGTFETSLAAADIGKIYGGVIEWILE